MLCTPGVAKPHCRHLQGTSATEGVRKSVTPGVALLMKHTGFQRDTQITLLQVCSLRQTSQFQVCSLRQPSQFQMRNSRQGLSQKNRYRFLSRAAAQISRIRSRRCRGLMTSRERLRESRAITKSLVMRSLTLTVIPSPVSDNIS